MDTLGRVPKCLARIRWGHLLDGEPWNPHTERKAPGTVQEIDVFPG